MIYDIIIIGSGPNSLLFILYITLYYPKLKILLITKKFEEFHCTYGCFLNQIENTWFIELLKKENVKLYEKYNSYVNCTNLKLINNKKLIKFIDYIVFDNYKFFNFLKNNILNNKNLIIIENTVIDIQKYNNLTSIFYYENKILKNLSGKIVIESVGHHKPLGIEFKNYKINYQIFYGIKILCKKKHNIKDIILLDWYDVKDNNITSFCYFIPCKINDKILFCEETILITDKINNNLYELLKNKLHKRLEEYNIQIEKILFEEKNSIILNRNIPEVNSITLGIGPCGNMMNNLSGYSIGYNIYHIPELINLIIKNNYNIKNIYNDYWCYYKRIIYFINKIGCRMMLEFNQKDFINFHNNFFSNYNEFIFRNIFLNCDSGKDKNIYKFINNCYIFTNYSYKYLFKIIYLILNYF